MKPGRMASSLLRLIHRVGMLEDLVLTELVGKTGVSHPCWPNRAGIN